MKRSFAILILIVLASNVFVHAQGQRDLEREKATATQSERRVALVIGNGAYTKAKPLRNPTNDATDMAKVLKDLGFEVISGVDLNKRQMENLIRDFGAKLASGGVGLFYYAGHGIQVAGENYLIPVNAEIPQEDEVTYEAVSVGRILTKMTTAKNDLNIVILDACRNNPFARSWRGFRDAANSDGLAKISPPTGTLMLYATEPGKVAADGVGRNGLFTESLLQHILKPNVNYDQIVLAVSKDVWERSNRQQLPWKEGNSLRDFYFLREETKGVKSNESIVAAKTPVQQESEAWSLINGSIEAEDFRQFLKEFPKGVNTGKARIKLDELVWASARNANKFEAVQAFLNEFPLGANAATARVLLRRLKPKTVALPTSRPVESLPDATKLSEQMLWNSIKNSTNINEFENYKKKYPNGDFNEVADLRLRNLKDAKAKIELRLRWQELLEQDDDDPVIRETTGALISSPSNVVAFRMRAQAYFHQEKFHLMRADVNSVIKLLEDPKSSEDFEALCYANWRLSKFDDALAGCNRAVEMSPKNVWALHYRGNVRSGKKDYENAITDFRNAIEIDPQFLWSYQTLSFLYYQLKDYDQAAKILDRAVETAPTNLNVYINRSNYYRLRKDYVSALKDLDQAIKIDPKSKRAFWQRALIFGDQKDYDKAIAEDSKAIEIAAQYAPAYIRRGLHYQGKGDPKLAIADNLKAIEIEPEALDAYYFRGEAYRLGNENDKAIADWNKFIGLNSRNGGNRSSSGFAGRARAYFGKKDYTKAFGDADKAIEIDPQSSWAYFTRAVF